MGPPPVVSGVKTPLSRVINVINLLIQVVGAHLVGTPRNNPGKKTATKRDPKLCWSDLACA